MAHYCTLTRALTFSDTPGVRACLVREILRIESVAVAAQTLAVSDGATRGATRRTTKVGPRVRGFVHPTHREGAADAGGAAGARETLVRALSRPVILAETLRETIAALAIMNVDVPLITSIAVALAVSVLVGGASTSTRARIWHRGCTRVGIRGASLAVPGLAGLAPDGILPVEVTRIADATLGDVPPRVKLSREGP